MPANRFNVLMLAALICAGGMLLAPDAAQAVERPLRATLSGNANLTPTDDPFVFRNDETARGTATHLGLVQWTSVEFADFAAIPGGVAVVGTFTMTAANGDQIFGQYTTTGLFADPQTLIISGTYEITNGTGRFAAAGGTGTLSALALLAPGLPVEAVLAGTIDY